MSSLDQSSLSAKNLEILRSGEYSDLTVICGSREWKVHRCIVCPRSSFFAAACKGDFLESHTKKILLEEDDPAIVEHMFKYLYSLEYNLIHLDGAPRDGECELLTHTAVYTLAEKYDIPDLKQHALSLFKKSADEIPIAHGTFLRIVRDTLPLLPANDKGLLREFLRMWTCAMGDFASCSKDKITKLDREIRFIAWRQVLVNNPDFTVSLLHEVIIHNAETGTAN